MQFWKTTELCLLQRLNKQDYTFYQTQLVQRNNTITERTKNPGQWRNSVNTGPATYKTLDHGIS